MKILVTGSGGMVGQAVCQALKEHILILPKRHELNVGNLDQVMRYLNQKPEMIIHLAAETDHEYCELNSPQCYFINTVGTGNMVRLADALRIPIVYLSAGSVFDGKKSRPYINLDEPNPLNHYNTSKYYGEVLVKDYSYHYILRAGWMFGGGPDIDKKFVNKIYQKIKRGDKSIKVCTDCIGSPTYSLDLAEAIKKLVPCTRPYGTYHVVNEGGCSRYEFAEAIVNILRKKVKIVPVKIDDLKEEFPCKRTNYEVLQSDFISRSWKEALKDYLNAHYRH